MAAPAGRKDRAGPPDSREEAVLDRLFETLDESDPAFEARLKAAVEEALADPRPAIPAAEAFARLNERIAAYKAKRAE